MAAPSALTGRNTARGDDETALMLAEFNKLVTNLRVLCTKLDADAGVTDTNYFGLVCDTTSTGPALINVIP